MILFSDFAAVSESDWTRLGGSAFLLFNSPRVSPSVLPPHRFFSPQERKVNKNSHLRNVPIDPFNNGKQYLKRLLLVVESSPTRRNLRRISDLHTKPTTNLRRLTYGILRLSMYSSLIAKEYQQPVKLSSIHIRGSPCSDKPKSNG